MVVKDFPIETDTTIIGVGPGGYVAAIRVAQLRQKITIVERGNLGGVCLNIEYIPSKALLHASYRFVETQHSENLGVIAENASLNFQKVQEFKLSVADKLTGGIEGLLESNKANVAKGKAYFVDNNSLRAIDEKSTQTHNFKNAIITIDPGPIEIPSFKFGRHVISSTGALDLQGTPGKLVIVGEGYIGSELGTAFASFGSEVIILESVKDISDGFEKQMTQSVKKGMKKKGVEIATETITKSAEGTDNGAEITCEAKDEEKTVEADYVLVTVGRRPNTDELSLGELGVEFTNRGLLEADRQSRTSISNIYTTGDVILGLPLTHKANYEAEVVVGVINGQAAEADYIGMLAVCLTESELATVGYSEAQAKEEGLAIKASRFPYTVNGCALSLDDINGFVKLITLKEDDTLIGVRVVGAGASDIISELGLATEAGMNAEDIVLTTHAHLTLSEMTIETAERATGYPIHTM